MIVENMQFLKEYDPELGQAVLAEYDRQRCSPETHASDGRRCPGSFP